MYYPSQCRTNKLIFTKSCILLHVLDQKIKFETTTGVYADIIQTDASVLETTWNLIDRTNLILKLDSFKELTAN